MIKKAVISAAGMGTRFLPAVKAYSKELIPILDKPQLQLVVEECIGAGIEEIAIVIRPENGITEKYFTSDEKLDKYLTQTGKIAYLNTLNEIWRKLKTLKFIHQDPTLPYGNGTPILCAKDFIDGKDFVYIFGDDLVIEQEKGKFLHYLMKLFESYQPDVIEAVQVVPHEDSHLYGMVLYKKEAVPNQMESIIEKPSIDETPSNMAQFGRFVCSQKVIEQLEKRQLGKGNELWLADQINFLAHNGIVIAEPIKEGRWWTTGDPLRWLIANIEAAKNDPRFAGQIKKYLNENKI